MASRLARSAAVVLQVAGASCAEEWQKVSPLAPAVVITAGGKPITAETGHAAPCVLDFDGDGKKDLLVGQFEGGTCRVYRNVGSQAAPEFGEFELLKAGDAPASMHPC